MVDELDERVRAAARAHEAIAPVGYLEAIERGVLARLAAAGDELSGDFSESVMISELNNDDDRGREAPRATGGDASDATDDSGLHDIRELAHSTKMRISRRITAQHAAVDDVLVTSSSGLRAVALPEPARLVSLPSLPMATGQVPAMGRVVELDREPESSLEAAVASAPKRTGLYAAIGGGVLAAAVALVMVVGGKPAARRTVDARDEAVVVPVDPNTPAGEPVKSAGAVVPAPPAESPARAAEVGNDTPAPVRAVEPPAPRKSDAAKPGASGNDRAADDAKPAQTAEPKTASRASESPAAVEKRADSGAKSGGSSDKSLEALLDEAAGSPTKPVGGAGGEAPRGPEKTGLDGKDIKAGMSAIAGRAQDCYDQHGVVGHVKVKATVDPSGKVIKADATGEFAGTPTGACVAGVVRTASFPAWTGGPMTVTYGFTLQE